MRSISSQRLGFWSVLALVTGSQIGTGVFMAPVHLAPFGLSGLWGWLISGIGAMALAYIFAQLCAAFPKTGGPHVYVQALLGRKAAFFVGWTYWVVSWVSTTAVISTMVGYIVPFIGDVTPSTLATLELIILAFFTGLNLQGVVYAGRAELILTLCKGFVFVLFPLAALMFFQWEHFTPALPLTWVDGTQTLGPLTLITLWGFVGLEAATAPAGSVENPHIVIPRAVLWGTFLVALLYAANSLCIMGALPGSALQNSHAPYADVAYRMWGKYGHILISGMGAVVCMGTLNAWILVSGQVALGLSESGLLPRFFQKKNASGAPIWSLILSALGLVPLLILTARPRLAEQVLIVVDVSVTALLFVYALCSVVYLMLWWRRSERSLYSGLIGMGALGFCLWVIGCLSWTTLAWASLVTLSGIPMFLWLRWRP